MESSYRLLCVGVLALALPFACGGDDAPFCGDGRVDPGEACDDDTEFCVDCQVVLPPQTTVAWSFNLDPVPDFGTDGCVDTGVSTVEVTVESDIPDNTQVLSSSCGFRQVVFSDLVPGLYIANVKALDVNGKLVTSAPILQSFNATTESQTVNVNIPPEAWLQDYTGSYFFEITWNGTDCASAVPAVAEQRVSMTRGGNSVTFLDSEGNSLDKSCTGGTQSAVMVPFGYAALTIQGLDDGGVVQYEEEFETFVGAGLSNGTFQFDLATPMGPDAGMPDAGMPDAGMPDAGVMPDANMVDATMP